MTFTGFKPAVQDLIKRIAAAVEGDTPIYLVGGAVRDMLLGTAVHDLDFCLTKGGIQTGRRVAHILKADFYPLDHSRDTGRVILESSELGRIKIDFAAWRGTTLENDLRDRDFTINAIAQNIHQPDQLIDPLKGAKDLEARVLRACSPKAFINDPVRILRAARMAVQFDLKILPETRKQMDSALKDLNQVSPERIRDELFRMLEGQKPAIAIRLLDALEAVRIALPETIEMKDVEQPAPHTLDVWNHSLTTVQKLTDILTVLSVGHDPEHDANWAMGLVSIRLGRYREKLHEHLSFRLNPERSLRALLMLAALYHDIGKPGRLQKDENGKIHFYGHDQTGGDLIRSRGEELKLNADEVDRLRVIVRNHMRPTLLAQIGELPSRRAVYRFFRDTRSAGVEICLLSLADRLATYGAELPQEVWIRQINVVRELLEAWWEQRDEKVSPPALLNGDTLQDVFELKPGPLIGDTLEALREAQAAGEVISIEEAHRFVRRLLNHG